MWGKLQKGKKLVSPESFIHCGAYKKSPNDNLSFKAIPESNKLQIPKIKNSEFLTSPTVALGLQKYT